MYEIGDLMKLFGILLVCAFMPLTALSFFQFRLPKKKEEFDNILRTLGVTEENASIGIPALKDEFLWKDFILPVGFATIIVLLGITALILGNDLRIARSPNLIWSGVHFPAHADLDATGDLKDGSFVLLYQQQSVAVVTMAFMGALIWSMQNIFRRLVTIDLSPAAYYGASIRIIFSIFVALAVRHFVGAADVLAVDQNANDSNYLVVLAFLIGMFPQRALHWLIEKTKILSESRKNAERASPLPLDMIEGITVLDKVRLAEIGIDNSQNLATAPLVELLLRTPFKPKQIIDWIAQARLYVYFKDDYEALRRNGVRTIIDLKKVGESEKGVQRLAEISKVAAEKIAFVRGAIKDDQEVGGLDAAAQKLSVIQRQTEGVPVDALRQGVPGE